MTELHTPQSIATTVRLVHQESRQKPVLLLEGHTDFMMYRNFLTHESQYQHIICHGKSILTETAALLDASGEQRVLSICDADYDRVLNTLPAAPVLMTDLHDSEMIVCASDALDRILREKLHLAGEIPERIGRVRDTAFEIARAIGKLRIQNQADSGGLNFKSVDPADFVDEWNFDVDEYLRALLDGSPRAFWRIDQLRFFMSENSLSGVGPDDLVNGHDLATLLDAFVTKPFNRSRTGREEFELVMRLAVSPDEFARTRLYLEIESWEIANDSSVLL